MVTIHTYQYKTIYVILNICIVVLYCTWNTFQPTRSCLVGHTHLSVKTRQKSAPAGGRWHSTTNFSTLFLLKDKINNIFTNIFKQKDFAKHYPYSEIFIRNIRSVNSFLSSSVCLNLWHLPFERCTPPTWYCLYSETISCTRNHLQYNYIHIH